MHPDYFLGVTATSSSASPKKRVSVGVLSQIEFFFFDRSRGKLIVIFLTAVLCRESANGAISDRVNIFRRCKHPSVRIKDSSECWWTDELESLSVPGRVNISLEQT
jgi:hypothetical protein